MVSMKKTQTKKLRVLADDRGYLFEALRKGDKLFDGKFGQVLVSVSKAGVIRAWHRHKKQTDYTCCVQGKILFGTAEEKKNGKAKTKKYVLDGKKPVLVKVPPKVWHGYKVLGKKEAMVLYIMDVPYNPKNPDEQRKEWNAFGKEVWKTKNK